MVVKYELKERLPKHEYFEVTIAAEYSQEESITATETYNQAEFDLIVPELVEILTNHSGPWELVNYRGCSKITLPSIEDVVCGTLESIDIVKYTTDGKSYDVYLKY